MNDTVKISGIWSVAGLLLLQLVTAWLAPAPETVVVVPDEPPPVVVDPVDPPTVTPIPFGPDESTTVIDANGLIVDAPYLVEALTLPPGPYRIYSSKHPPQLVVVGEYTVPGPPVPVTPTTPPVVKPTTKATAVVYVYEKDQGSVPPPVLAAIDRINRELNILATPFEDDSKNGLGTVPLQYRAAVEAARRDGTPLLVVLAGDTVIQRVSAPKTSEEVWRAVAP